MRKYIFIGFGGVLGAILRYLIKEMHIINFHEKLPLHTLIVNITGSFILVLILTIAFDIWRIDTSIRLGVTAGFLGAYTTFSTLCKETVVLLQQGFYYSAIFYIILSILLGLTAAYLGFIAARRVVSKLVKKGMEGGVE